MSYPLAPGIRSVLREVTVLVASSDDSSRSRIMEWLEGARDVVHARDGHEALTRANEVRPTIVILDRKLQGISEDVVAWVLRTDRRHRGCAVLMLQERDPAGRPAAEGGALSQGALLDALSRSLPDSLASGRPERRLVPRTEMRLLGRLVVGARGAPAEILSLSPVGAFVRTSLLASPGDRALLTFECPEGLFEGAADVVNASVQDESHGLGLRFCELPESTMRVLLAVLDVPGKAETQSPGPRELETLVGRLRLQQAAMAGLAASELWRSEDVAAALREACEVTAWIVGVERASVWLLSEDRRELRCRALYEASLGRHSSGLTLRAEDYPAYFAALAAGRALDAEDAATDPRTREFREGYLAPLGITSMMDAAIHLEGTIVGVVCHEHVGARRRWQPDEVSFAGAIADQVALILGAERRRRTERALAEAESRTRLVLEEALDAVVTIDAHGVVTSWNPMAERLFGFPSAEAIGKPLAELIIPARYRPAHQQGLRRFLETGEGSVLRRRMEVSALHRSGTELPVELSIAPVRIGDTWIFSAFVRDLTVEREMRRELTETSAQLEAIFQSFPDLYFWIRRDGTHLRHHAARREDLFLAPDRFLGRRIDEVLPASVAEPLMSGVRRALDEQALVSVEYSLPFEEGERHFEARLLPLAVDVVFMMVRDITERVELLRREQKARETAEHALTVREEFLSVASHELRTPLTSLQLAVQQGLALPMFAEQPEARRYLQMAERQAKRLGVLVDRLLDVSRIQTGHMDLELAEVDLTTVVRRVLEGFREELASAGSSLCVTAPGPIVGRWDASRLEQVISNLAANAIKYGGGSPIEVTLRADEATAELDVRDHGLGIAPEHRERIFAPFARAAPVRSYGGLGLGLFIVAEIVRAHGGSVGVESAPGEGATFTVRLPRQGAVAPPGRP